MAGSKPAPQVAPDTANVPTPPRPRPLPERFAARRPFFVKPRRHRRAAAWILPVQGGAGAPGRLPFPRRRERRPMPNDAKLGLVVGVGLVIAVAVLFFRKEAPPDAPAGEAAPAGIVHPIPPPPLPSDP